jgi:hypothetical protein
MNKLLIVNKTESGWSANRQGKKISEGISFFMLVKFRPDLVDYDLRRVVLLRKKVIWMTNTK